MNLKIKGKEIFLTWNSCVQLVERTKFLIFKHIYLEIITLSGDKVYKQSIKFTSDERDLAEYYLDAINKRNIGVLK